MKPVLSYWQFDITSFLIVVLVLLLFLFHQGWKRKAAIVPFSVAFILLMICFFSPLSILSSYYLFSAHMTVHVLLLLLAGPLLMLSICSGNTKAFLSSFFRFFARNPLWCWVIGVGMMWWWHVPVIFNHTMQMHSSGINWMSFIESSSLILAGMLFSLPVLSPQKEERIPALSGVVYLFTACIGCSLLGLLITFAPTTLYHHYLAMHDMYGLNTVITTQWHLTKSIDQQIAGLIMWVPCCFVYVIACMYLLMKWFSEKETVQALPIQHI